MIKDPFRYQEGQRLSNTENLLSVGTLAVAVGSHYLGNRYIYRWCSDSQLLTASFFQGVVGAVASRTASNIYPTKIVTVINGEGQTTTTIEGGHSIRTLLFWTNIFSPMFCLSPFGLQNLDFLSTIGFAIHGLLFFATGSVVGGATVCALGIAGAIYGVRHGWIQPDSLKNDHYETLRVSRTATEEEIKGAFKTLAVLHHPDRNQGREAEAAEEFKKIRASHDILIDPVKRASYDKWGVEVSTPQALAAESLKMYQNSEYRSLLCLWVGFLDREKEPTPNTPASPSPEAEVEDPPIFTTLDPAPPTTDVFEVPGGLD